MLEHLPPLDPEFQPASVWKREFKEKSSGDGHRIPLVLGLGGAEGELSVLHRDEIEGLVTPAACLYIERLVKFLLWQRGGCTITVGGSDEVADYLEEAYCKGGAREFDVDFIGRKLFGSPVTIRRVNDVDSLSLTTADPISLGRHLDGCRIGFDLGGSDRKAAAVIDGEVVFSEEIPWDPYFQSDPQYHIDGIRNSLRRAAAHLPRIDAIGGSAAGVYVDNEARAGSLFRGISAEDFDHRVRRIFFDVMEAEGWQEVPWNVVNDGDVTALAGAMSLQANSVLGLSMGTSEAVGYVDSEGSIRPWLNELAFAPIDYRNQAPIDEWSGDRGCGVQYFSQQAVARLIPKAEIPVEEGTPFAAQLEQVQGLMADGDPRAAAIYETIGVYLGYTIPHYADFYEIEHLLILGRVTSGEGGAIIIEKANQVLRDEFPELADRIQIHTPNEQDKRHGQAVAAASLPPIG
ncbi:MAG: ROK family protein [Verrucomicrobiota bacterium]